MAEAAGIVAVICFGVTLFMVGNELSGPALR
jgi:hypothetical protein